MSLVLNKDSLSPDIKNYLNEYSFKSGSNLIYNAPSIFKVDCIKNANFVIIIYYKNGKKFKENRSILAMAQIKGRTIIFNMQTHSLIYEQKLFDVRLNDDLNIVPIITHELGHCFGLPHLYLSSSIMASTIKNISKLPTKNDGLNFSKILAQKLIGKSAGYFNPSECSGLIFE